MAFVAAPALLAGEAALPLMVGATGAAFGTAATTAGTLGASALTAGAAGAVGAYEAAPMVYKGVKKALGVVKDIKAVKTLGKTGFKGGHKLYQGTEKFATSHFGHKSASGDRDKTAVKMGTNQQGIKVY